MIVFGDSNPNGLKIPAVIDSNGLFILTRSSSLTSTRHAPVSKVHSRLKAVCEESGLKQ